MSMYALLRNNPTPTMADVEEAFHGRLPDGRFRQSGSTQQKTCGVFFFFNLFRKSVSLHRLQAHTGGVQILHRGQTRVSSNDLTI